ncbi:MAG: hypothetical protein ACR2NA_00965 [Solirubrobacterales bacterium]
MLLTDLTRATVLVVAVSASVLGTLTVLRVDAGATATVIFVAAWWTLALAAGAALGRRSPTAPGALLPRLLAAARSDVVMPQVNPVRVALGRLWPLLVAVPLAGVATLQWPPVGAIATGYALLWALSWRRIEPAVSAVELRDGCRFFVEPDPVWRPLRLVRAHGLGGERQAIAGDPPDPAH